MTTYSWDAGDTPAPTQLVRRLVSNAAVKRSVLTGAIQTVSRPGERWEIDVTWENIKGAELNKVLAFLRRVNGPEHRIQFHTYDADNQGEWGVNPVVDGASQTGNSLNFRSGSLSQTDFMKAGDYFRVSEGGLLSLKQVVADVDTDGAGDGTVSFIPAIRTSPIDGTVLDGAGGIYGTYILTTPVEAAISSRSKSGGAFVATVSVSMVEAIV